MTRAAFASARPAVSVDELKRAWHAVQAGQFRHTRRTHSRLGHTAPVDGRAAEWVRAPGEHVVPILGAVGSAGTSTVALALALAVERPTRVVECGPAIASGLASASTAEMGLHETGWRQGKRDTVLLERTSEPIAGADDAPTPTPATHEDQLTILDVGWEASGVLTGAGWLTAALSEAPAIVMVTPATVPAFRRLDALLELFVATHPTGWERLCLAVVGPPRKKWPRGLEHTGGRLTRRVLASDRVVQIPHDRDLAVNGLDSRPLPEAVLTAAALLLSLVDRPGSPSRPRLGVAEPTRSEFRSTSPTPKEPESGRAGHIEGNLSWSH